MSEELREFHVHLLYPDPTRDELGSSARLMLETWYTVRARDYDDAVRQACEKYEEAGIISVVQKLPKK